MSKITMKEAIRLGISFEFEGDNFIHKNESYKNQGFRVVKLKWILENQDKLVEVEDNYFDKDGRAIRELEDGMDYEWLDGESIYSDKWGMLLTHNCRLKYGWIFKDKKSAEAELTRLKDKQKNRME